MSDEENISEHPDLQMQTEVSVVGPTREGVIALQEAAYHMLNVAAINAGIAYEPFMKFLETAVPTALQLYRCVGALDAGVGVLEADAKLKSGDMPDEGDMMAKIGKSVCDETFLMVAEVGEAVPDEWHMAMVKYCPEHGPEGTPCG